LAPGVHVSGWVTIGARAYVGTGATIINGHRGAPLTIGDDAVIGAGACVTKSVEAGTTVVGVPAPPPGSPPNPPMSLPLPPPAPAPRGALADSPHPVAVAVTVGSGRLIAASLDPRLITFWRSAAKPFQALATVDDVAADRYGLGVEGLALACASHSSEPVHLE